jgi:hypothetical protein
MHAADSMVLSELLTPFAMKGAHNYRCEGATRSHRIAVFRAACIAPLVCLLPSLPMLPRNPLSAGRTQQGMAEFLKRG